MLPVFAVIPDAAWAVLAQAGLLGPVVYFFMRWFTRDREMQVARDAQLSKTLSEREHNVDRRHDEMLEAITHLIRITAIEAMSRPKQTDRAKQDVEEIMRAVAKRKGQ